MNNYEDDYLSELEYAGELFDIDDRVIKDFKRESRQNKSDKNKKLNKKTSKIKIDLEEKE